MYRNVCQVAFINLLLGKVLHELIALSADGAVEYTDCFSAEG